MQNFWSKQGEDLKFPSKSDWVVIMMGYGSGLIIGFIIGHNLAIRELEQFAKKFGRWYKWIKKVKHEMYLINQAFFRDVHPWSCSSFYIFTLHYFFFFFSAFYFFCCGSIKILHVWYVKKVCNPNKNEVMHLTCICNFSFIRVAWWIKSLK